MDDIELPPLPEGMIGMHCTCFDRSDMEDYARAAILADRARRVSAEPVAWTTMPDADDWLFLSGSANPNGKLTGDWRPLYLAPPPTPPADAMLDRLAQAERERDALRADAARFRWLHDHHPRGDRDDFIARVDAGLAWEKA